MVIVVFLLVTLLALGLFYLGTGSDKRILFFSMLWLGIVGFFSYTGYFQNAKMQPPGILFVLLVSIVLSVCCYIIVPIPKIRFSFLMAISTLRLPVEILLYQLFLLKKVPVLMTFKGWNFDILIGVSAIFLLFYSFMAKQRPNKWLLFTWNIAGILFLLNIVLIAILSSPLPIQQFGFEQPNVAVLEFPFTYLPAFIVPVVFLSHLLLMKKEQRG